MKIIQAKFPTTRYGGEYEPQALDEFDMNHVPAGTDLVVYYYATGSYCGSGQALHRRNGEWFHSDLSHCSCFGPGEGFHEAKPVGPCFKEWLDNATQDFRDEVKPLFDALKGAAEGGVL